MFFFNKVFVLVFSVSLILFGCKDGDEKSTHSISEPSDEFPGLIGMVIDDKKFKLYSKDSMNDEFYFSNELPISALADISIIGDKIYGISFYLDLYELGSIDEKGSLVVDQKVLVSGDRSTDARRANILSSWNEYLYTVTTEGEIFKINPVYGNFDLIGYVDIEGASGGSVFISGGASDSSGDIYVTYQCTDPVYWLFSCLAKIDLSTGLTDDLGRLSGVGGLSAISFSGNDLYGLNYYGSLFLIDLSDLSVIDTGDDLPFFIVGLSSK